MRIILAAVLVILASLTVQSAPKTPEQKSPNPQQTAPADQRGTDQLPAVVRILPTPKTAEETETDRKERAEKAETDWWLIKLTGTLALVGVLQLIVFGQQARRLRQTVEAAAQQSKDMEQSIAESARAATAMERVASTIQKNSTNQLRAYVSVFAGAFIEQTRELNFEYQPGFINTGFTPAYNVILYSKAAVLPYPLPTDFDFSVEQNPEASVSVLGFQQKTFSVAGLNRKLSADELAQIQRPNSDMRLYNYGHVTYDDLFGNPHRTNFCFYTIWGSAAPVSMNTRRHNDAT